MRSSTVLPEPLPPITARVAPLPSVRPRPRRTRAAPPPPRQRRALAERQAQPAQHRLVAEVLPHLAHFHQRLALAHGHHQKRMRRSLVRKKSETITPIATCTTVAVVERPSPSVPPSVARPL